MAKAYKDFESVSSALLDELRNRVEKDIGSRGVKTARDAAFASLKSDWDSYVSGIDDVQTTKMEGHPVSGSVVNNATAQEKYGTVITGSRTGGAPAFTYLLYRRSALDSLTSDGESIPYWYMFNWGSGRNLSGELPASANKSYNTRSGESTNITKSYASKWLWYPKMGKGDRGQGFIIAADVVVNKDRMETINDFKAGHMFDHAAKSFIERFRRFLEAGG